MKNALLAVWNFYLEGFRSMTLGRTLWVIILLKLFVMFFILKLFSLANHSTNCLSCFLDYSFSRISLVITLRRQKKERMWVMN